MSERYVALTLAAPRADWFTDVAGWATAGVVPLELDVCMSIDELRVHLDGARPYSAVLVDERTSGLDRDVLQQAMGRGISAVIVGDATGRDWRSLGAAAVLPLPLERTALLDALSSATPVADRTATSAVELLRDAPAGPLGPLVAVTGPGGTGSSTIAAAVAQGLATRAAEGAVPPDPEGSPDPPAGPTAGAGSASVLLLDGALRADQAVLHDAGDVVPGLQELVEAHRHGEPGPTALAELTFEVPLRGYDLLLGLRRQRDWTAIRPRAYEAALANLRSRYAVVVAEVTGDVEGHLETGSFDVEDRNAIARTTTRSADVVVVVGTAGAKGVHRWVQLISELVAVGITPERIVPVCNRAPRHPGQRADLHSALTELTAPVRGGAPLAPTTFVGARKRLEATTAQGAQLPGPLVDPVVGAVHAVLERARAGEAPTAAPSEVPEPIAPGTLGVWAQDLAR